MNTTMLAELVNAGANISHPRPPYGRNYVRVLGKGCGPGSGDACGDSGYDESGYFIGRGDGSGCGVGDGMPLGNAVVTEPPTLYTLGLPSSNGSGTLGQCSC